MAASLRMMMITIAITPLGMSLGAVPYVALDPGQVAPLEGAIEPPNGSAVADADGPSGAG